MSQPHHFEREIRSSIKSNEKLLDLLVERNVVREVDKKRFAGKNGMKILTSYMRIKDFEAFVTFLECIRDISESEFVTEVERSVDSSILGSVCGAVKIFDEKYGTKFIDKIPRLKRAIGAKEESKAIATGSKMSHQHDVLLASNANELDCLFLVSEPVQVQLDNYGGTVFSKLSDFEITVPAGAVSKGQVTTIRAATCTLDAFTIPSDVYRISDFVCITSDRDFESNVTVKIAHCLEMPEYEDSPAIRVMHSKYSKESLVFYPLDCRPSVSSTEPFISFQVQRFCIFCVAYFPSAYRGAQKPRDSDQQRVGNKMSKKRSKSCKSPYARTPFPCLEYVLLFYEQEDGKLPLRVQIFACLNCPGSIELCNRQMKRQGEWKSALSKNFDFTTTKVIVMDVKVRVDKLKDQNEGWIVATKMSTIAEHEIQKPEYTTVKGKTMDESQVKSLEMLSYPPKMALEATPLSPTVPYRKLDIIIKDGRDGRQILSDPYEVILSVPFHFVTGQRSAMVDPVEDKSDLNIKHSLSKEEEKFLDERLTYSSIVSISKHIKYWKPVAKKLPGMSEVEIVHLESDYSSQRSDEQIFQMLYSWMRKCEKATYRELVQALTKCQETVALDFILDNIQNLISSK